MEQEERMNAESAANPTELWAQVPELKNSKLFHEYATRLVNNRDMIVYITAASETGVGKTTLAYALAMCWDQHGWTPEKATLSPREYSRKYDEVPPGSVLLLDEAEQAVDNRRGMTDENLNVSHDLATKRYKQIFTIMTLPGKGWMDDRVTEDAADYWIQALETDDGKAKGEAKVYRLKSNEHYQRNYTQRTEILSWPRLDHDKQFQELEELKANRMEGESAMRYVKKEEADEKAENYWNKAWDTVRNDMIRAMDRWGLSYTDIAEMTEEAEEVDGLHRTTVGRIAKGEVDP